MDINTEEELLLEVDYFVTLAKHSHRVIYAKGVIRKICSCHSDIAMSEAELNSLSLMEPDNHDIEE